MIRSMDSMVICGSKAATWQRGKHLPTADQTGLQTLWMQQYWTDDETIFLPVYRSQFTIAGIHLCASCLLTGLPNCMQHAVQKFDYLKNDHALHSTPKRKCIFSDKIVLSLLGVLDPNYLWFPILQSLFFDCWCMRCTPAASVTVAKLVNKQKNIQPVVQHWDSERMQAQLSTWRVNHKTRTQGQWTIHKTDKYMQNVAGWCDPWTKYHWKNCW